MMYKVSPGPTGTTQEKTKRLWSRQLPTDDIIERYTIAVLDSW